MSRFPGSVCPGWLTSMVFTCCPTACPSFPHPCAKRVFDLVKDFGTSESPKSTRSSTTHWCPGRPGHPAFRHNIASSLRLHTGLPYDWTPRSDAPLGSPLAPSARRVSRVASRLPGTTRLRFALHGGQRTLSGTCFQLLNLQRTGNPFAFPGRLCSNRASTTKPCPDSGLRSSGHHSADRNSTKLSPLGDTPGA